MARTKKTTHQKTKTERREISLRPIHDKINDGLSRAHDRERGIDGEARWEKKAPKEASLAKWSSDEIQLPTRDKTRGPTAAAANRRRRRLLLVLLLLLLHGATAREAEGTRGKLRNSTPRQRRTQPCRRRC
ncbi:hypothetical protein ACJRO7_025860 [Eucalyptus globulus]|uniref:Uncharacterized protein n=1 Tax=Eucalyptus globulus TaxID=34317 RepID=A0ABD3KAF9_EUCGL